MANEIKKYYIEYKTHLPFVEVKATKKVRQDTTDLNDKIRNVRRYQAFNLVLLTSLHLIFQFCVVPALVHRYDTI